MATFNLQLDSSTAGVGQVITKTDDFTVIYRDPLLLSGVWQVALAKSNLFYTWSNVRADKFNNVFKYNNSVVDRPIALIQDGQYATPDLNDVLHGIMRANGDFTLVGTTEIFDINLVEDRPTGKVKIEISNGYKLDLQTDNLYLLLGFDQIEVTVTQVGARLANLNDNINSLFIRSSIVDPSGSYNNDIGSDILYSFVPETLPSTNINVVPNFPLWLPVSLIGNRLNRIRLYLTDDLNRRIDLNGEPFSALLTFRQLVIED